MRVPSGLFGTRKNPVETHAPAEAFQGAKATSHKALKTGDMGLSKHRQATQLNRQNTTTQ